jgi:alpha-beta hydrolase superfamily lysophospholipase
MPGLRHSRLPVRPVAVLTDSPSGHSLEVVSSAAYAGDPLSPVYTYADGPADAARALLVVSPLASEAVGSRRAVVQLVRALAARGHGALMIDPRGTGESAGEPEDVTFEALCADLRLGLRELESRFPVALPHVLAFRYAAAAALVVADDEIASRVLLIDPCLDPEAALRQDLRHEIARRVMRRGSSGESRDDLLARLDAGVPVVVDGQRLSPALYAGLVASVPASALARRGERATVLTSGRSTFPAVHAHANLGAFFDHVPELETTVAEWLEQ